MQQQDAVQISIADGNREVRHLIPCLPIHAGEGARICCNRRGDSSPPDRGGEIQPADRGRETGLGRVRFRGRGGAWSERFWGEEHILEGKFKVGGS